MSSSCTSERPNAALRRAHEPHNTHTHSQRASICVFAPHRRHCASTRLDTPRRGAESALRVQCTFPSHRCASVRGGLPPTRVPAPVLDALWRCAVRHRAMTASNELWTKAGRGRIGSSVRPTSVRLEPRGGQTKNSITSSCEHHRIKKSHTAETPKNSRNPASSATQRLPRCEPVHLF